MLLQRRAFGRVERGGSLFLLMRGCCPASSWCATSAHTLLRSGGWKGATGEEQLKSSRLGLRVSRGLHSTVLARQQDIFSQTFEKVEEKLQQEEAEGKPKEEEKKNEVRHKEKNLRISRKNLNPLLRQIRGLNYREAMVQLTFCHMRIGPKIMAAIEKCRIMADKAKLNPDRLLVGTSLDSPSRTNRTSHHSRSFSFL